MQIRSKLKGETRGGTVYGPQIEIEASGENGAEAGYIYGEGIKGWLTPDDERIPHKHFRNRTWNHYRILAEGPRIRVWINGKQISDLTYEAIYKTHAEGIIGLQVHGVGDQRPFSVSWKNLKIHEIN